MAFSLEHRWKDKLARSRRARRLRYRAMFVSLFATPVYLLFAAINLFVNHAPTMATTSAVSAAINLLAILLLLKTKSDTAGGHCFTLALAVQVIGEMAFNGGMLAPATPLAVLIVPAAVFTAGARAVWPWVTLTVLATATIVSLDWIGLLPANELSAAAQRIDRLFSVIVGITIGATLILLYDRQVDAVMTKLAKERADFKNFALHDPLTGLPNRRQFYDHCNSSLEEAKITSCARILFYIDIDRFKQINDKYGHAIGDVLLIEFATRLQEKAESNEMAARLAGDEFAMFCEFPLTQYWTEKRIDDLRKVTDTPVVVDNLILNTGMSIGYARFPEDGDDLDTLLSIADARMYDDKSNNKLSTTLPPGGSVIPLPKKAVGE